MFTKDIISYVERNRVLENLDTMTEGVKVAILRAFPYRTPAADHDVNHQS